MKKDKWILGVAPTRRDTRDFDLKYAWENKRKILEIVKETASEYERIEVVDLEWLNEEGLLIHPWESQRVAEVFTEKGVDALFLPHCNFGAEEAVALLGKKVGKPLLLWGPRDQMPPPDGPRQTDTQCGLFASGLMLRRYGVPFTYLENCAMDSPLLKEGIRSFIQTSNVVKAFRELRILQISVRPRTFLSVKVNENELLERFGIGVVTVDFTEMQAEIENVLERKGTEMQMRVERLREHFCTQQTDEEDIIKLAGVEQGIRNLAERYHCSAVASECWRTFSVPFGIMPCAGFGELIEEGLPVACECDIHGAVSSVLLSAAAMDQKPHFLADVTMRHPQNDNGELLWHCGPFPASLARAGCRPVLKQCLGQFELEEGELTLCRFGGIRGRYSLFAEKCHTTQGPPTNGSYVWIETPDWPAWERKLVTGPYIHHISGIYGDYTKILHEACRYLGIESDRV